MADPRCWLVYSREHNAFWRPSAAGYTNLIEDAGRYTKAEAEAHCSTRDPRAKDDPPEVAVIAPEFADAIGDPHEKTIERALRQYADLGMFDGRSMRGIQVDLRAIAGDKHIHRASIGSDECILCCRYLRDEIHLRSSTRD